MTTLFVSAEAQVMMQCIQDLGHQLDVETNPMRADVDSLRTQWADLVRRVYPDHPGGSHGR